MSRYLDLLKSEKASGEELTKLTQPGSVSFVGSPDGCFRENGGASVSFVGSPDGCFQKIAAHDDLPAFPAHQAEVVATLAADPTLRYAYTTRTLGESVIITLAVRDVAVADLSVPRDRYDGFDFMRVIQEEFS